MTPTTRDLMSEARDVIKRRAMAVILIAVLFLSLQTVVSILESRLSGQDEYAEALLRHIEDYTPRIASAENTAVQQDLILEMLDTQPELPVPSTMEWILLAVLALASMLLAAGYQYHALLESRRFATDWRSLFYAMNHPMKILIIQVLTGLLVVLGTIAFIVPGIILALRYSLALMVLYDNPEYGPVRCMKESARLMKGNKMRLFKLELAFIPWTLLASLFTLWIPIPLLNIWVTPYYNISRGTFYSQLTVGSWHAGVGEYAPDTGNDDDGDDGYNDL